MPWIPYVHDIIQESTTILLHTIGQLNVSKYLGKFIFEASNNSSNDFLFGQVASFEIAVVAWQKYTCILISAALAVIGLLTVEEGDYVTLINQIITKRKTESEIFMR